MTATVDPSVGLSPGTSTLQPSVGGLDAPAAGAHGGSKPATTAAVTTPLSHSASQSVLGTRRVLAAPLANPVGCALPAELRRDTALPPLAGPVGCALRPHGSRGYGLRPAVSTAYGTADASIEDEEAAATPTPSP